MLTKRFSTALVLGIWGARFSLADGPILTGISRHSGQVRAFFQTPDRQTSFALGLGGGWGGYRLVSVDFAQRSAVIEEGEHQYTTRFGDTSAEPQAESISPISRGRKRTVFATSPEEEEYRIKHGRAALAKWQQEQMLQKLEAEGKPGNGIVRPEIIANDDHR